MDGRMRRRIPWATTRLQTSRAAGGRFVRNAQDGNGGFVACDAVRTADRQAMADARDIVALSEVYLPATGGHINWQHEVYKRLGNVCVLTAKMPGLPSREQIDGVTVRRIRLSRWSILRPESLLLYGNLAAHCLQQVLRTRPVALIAARVLPEGLVAGIIGRALGIPVFTFAHGEEVAVYGQEASFAKNSTTARMKRWFLWKGYALSRTVIANSRFTFRLLRQGGGPGRRIELVHPGTDPAVFRPGPKSRAMMQRWNIDNGPVLLTVGALCERKGQDTMIRAMPQILAEFPQAQYLIAGSGPKRLMLEALASELGVRERVFFLGRVPDAELPDLYNLADVFVMANRVLEGQGEVEGFGIVFLEASAAGKPVIGGNTGGTEDAIQEGVTGLRIDARDPATVARAVVSILKHPELAREFGRQGRQRVLKDFTWDRSAAGIRQLILRYSQRPHRSRV